MEMFERTSEEPYVKHDYKLIFTNGKTIVFDNYEDVLMTWFENCNYCDRIEVLDKKQKKQTKTKGFNKK